jgi:hypothetical protein
MNVKDSLTFLLSAKAKSKEEKEKERDALIFLLSHPEETKKELDKIPIGKAGDYIREKGKQSDAL